MEMLCVHTAVPSGFITDFDILFRMNFFGVRWASKENSLSVFEHPLGSHWDAVMFIIHESTINVLLFMPHTEQH